jgi:hypothetical protein
VLTRWLAEMPDPSESGRAVDRRCLWTIAFTGMVVIVSWSNDALAQAGAPSAPAAAGAAGRRFDISGRIRAEYDSNVARSSRAVADIRDVRPDDIKYTPSLSVDLGMPVGRQSVFLQGDAGYELYQYNKDLKRERVNLTGGVAGRVGRCSSALTGIVNRGVSDYEDFSLGAQRSVQRTLTGSLFAGCQIGASLGASLSAMHTETTNSGGATFVGSNTDGVTGALSYGSPSAGSISLTAGVTSTRYGENPLAAVMSPGFDTYSLGLQYSRPIGARLNGRAAVAYYQLQSKSAEASDQNGLSVDVGLAYRASDRLSGNLSYSRTIGATNRIGANSTVEQRGQVGVTYRLSSRLRANLGGTLSRRTYGTPPLPGALFASREDRKTIRAGVSFDVGRRSSILFDAAVDDINADLDTLDYTAEKVGVTLSTSF